MKEYSNKRERGNSVRIGRGKSYKKGEGKGEIGGRGEASVQPRAHIWLWPHVLIDISRRQPRVALHSRGISARHNALRAEMSTQEVFELVHGRE